jgi:hypothetical protein
VAAQVLVELGAELNRVRQQVTQLISGQQRQEKWVAGYPALPLLAERYQQLADEVERLRAVLRQHGIDPQDKPA